MRIPFLSGAIILLLLSGIGPAQDLRAEEEVRIRNSPPLIPGLNRLGTQAYPPLEDEGYYAQKITEKPVQLWEEKEIPKPPGMSEQEWLAMKAQLDEEAKALQPSEKYELAQQSGQYVGWFGILRGREFDAQNNRSVLRLEHKYFDGMIDLHLQIVSIFGAGDFLVSLPGKVEKDSIPELALLCVYGQVEKTKENLPLIKAEYVRVWDWSLFTFMDYGKDKSNPAWVKLRQISPKDIYDPAPAPAYYEQVLGPRAPAPK